LAMQILLACVISVLIGALPFGLWVGLLKGVDIRTLGSKNIGATNVLRVLGPAAGLIVFALDTVKGAAGILLAVVLLLPGLDFPWRVLIGFCAVLGHTFSPFLRFKGGKGVATTLGVLLALSWPVGLIALGVWMLVVLLSRYVSLASIAAGLSLPIASWFVMPAPDRGWMVGLTVVITALVIIKHRDNLARLLAGTEAKFGQRVAAPTEETGHDA